MLNIFVTATNNSIGKTFISAGLAATMQSLGYSTCVYKPVQTNAIEKNGFAQSPDLAFVKNIDPYVKIASSYLLKGKNTPYTAAEAEGIVIDKNIIKNDYTNIIKDSECNILDGEGGLMTPLAPYFMNCDLIKILDIPTILIVKPGASGIDQTLLSIHWAQEKGIKVRGVIINDYLDTDKTPEIKELPRLIEEFSDAKILGVIKHFENNKKINPNDLITHILNGIDIESVFNIKIAKLDTQ